MTGAVLAFAALIPLAAGTVPEAERTLTLSLCSGGEITLPLGDDDAPQRDCDPQGCHGATCREKERGKGQRERN